MITQTFNPTKEPLASSEEDNSPDMIDGALDTIQESTKNRFEGNKNLHSGKKVLLTTKRDTVERRNPIALLDLACYLRSFGFLVVCKYLDQLDSESKDEHYDIVGLSVLQAIEGQDPVVDAVALKEKYGARTVVGGKWTRTLDKDSKQILSDSEIEICIGAGETYFVDQELDLAHYPSWDRTDLESLGEAYTEIMSTRGCPYHCNFCHNTETRISYFNEERTADNVQLLFDLGVKSIFFVDDIFTLKASHMASVYLALKRRGVDIENRCMFFTHVKHVREDVLEWMKKFQPTCVQIGIESGDDRMLKAMGKTFKAHEAEETVKLLHANGIVLFGLFLIGYPGETVTSLKNTLKFIRRNHKYIPILWASLYQPVPETVGYELAISRMPNFKGSKKNYELTYIDPNLSQNTLLLYQYLMLENLKEKNPIKRVAKELVMRLFPFSVTKYIRECRKRIFLLKRTLYNKIKKDI